MNPNPWPWSLDEEAEWEEKLRQQEFGWMETMISDMVNDGLAGPSYDPLQPQDDSCEEEVSIP